MRKLFLLAAAAAVAFFGGRGLARKPTYVPRLGRLSIRDILSLWLAPRWMRPAMLARAVVTARRTPPRR